MVVSRILLSGAGDELATLVCGLCDSSDWKMY